MNINIHTPGSTTLDLLKFTISGVDVSVVNALRRTLLTDIEIWGMYKQINIEKNTSKLTDEILQNRISCIPVNLPIDFPDASNLEISLHVVNQSSDVMVVTTQDIVITNKTTNSVLSDVDTVSIFPPDPITGYFIDIVRLRPEISTIQGKTIVGEEVKLTCMLEKVTSGINAMFNAVSLASFGNTEDKERQTRELVQLQKKWQQDETGMTENEIDRKSKNWWLLDGKRICVLNSFEFAVETIGIYSNYQLMDKACQSIISAMREWNRMIDDNTLRIIPSRTTLINGFDIIVESGNSTVGNLIVKKIYTTFYKKPLTYCAYGKFHPHNDTSIIRIAFKEEPTITAIHGMLKTCIRDIEEQFETIKNAFMQGN